jgi:hypothetical protein
VESIAQPELNISRPLDHADRGVNAAGCAPRPSGSSSTSTLLDATFALQRSLAAPADAPLVGPRAARTDSLTSSVADPTRPVPQAEAAVRAHRGFVAVGSAERLTEPDTLGAGPVSHARRRVVAQAVCSRSGVAGTRFAALDGPPPRISGLVHDADALGTVHVLALSERQLPTCRLAPGSRQLVCDAHPDLGRLRCAAIDAGHL